MIKRTTIEVFGPLADNVERLCQEAGLEVEAPVPKGPNINDWVIVTEGFLFAPMRGKVGRVVSYSTTGWPVVEFAFPLPFGFGYKHTTKASIQTEFLRFWEHKNGNTGAGGKTVRMDG